MDAQNRKAIFAMCRQLNIDNDDRHALIYGITGKESTKELTDAEAKAVIGELAERVRVRSRSLPLEKRKPKVYSPSVAGMMTPEQQSLAWRLIYRLIELDGNPKGATVAERMVGAIKKELGITAAPGKEIFKWVSFNDGSKLIEQLKRYVRSAEGQSKKTGGDKACGG